MENNGKSMVLASFAADSLALGVHWIYDTTAIKKKFGTVDSFLKPLPDSYHPAKKLGEFTHYGDQAFVLLQSLALKKRFDLEDFSARWENLFKDYNGYYDHATKDTINNLKQGIPPDQAGSLSQDLAGASRIAPLVFCYRDDLDTLVDSVRAQTCMTHNDAMVIECGEFFARVAFKVLKGEAPISAMESTVKENFGKSPLSKWVREGIKSKAEESVSIISDLGQSCYYGDAFPGVIHLIAKYEDNLKEALIQSVMAGGDNAGRGMAVGMILGAYRGMDSLPGEWISEMKRAEEIEELLDMAP